MRGRARGLAFAGVRAGLLGVVRAGLLGVVLAGVVAGCGIGSPGTVAPTPSPPPEERLSGGIEVTRGIVEAALRAKEFGLIRAKVPFRSAESTALIDAWRGVFQVVLAGDPDGGFLVIYEFPDPSAAYGAGLAQAAWLASGPGAIQAPPDTRYVLRQVGNTLVLFGWSLATSPDPRTAEVATALDAVGQGIPVGP